MSDIDDDHLPSNVIRLSTFKIDYQKQKRCECYRHSYPKKQPSFVLDYQNREITCKHCGTVVDPIDAFEVLAKEQDGWQRELDQAYDDALKLREYKPWRKAIKLIEARSNNGKMIPSCPHCGRGILIEEIGTGGWGNKQREIECRRFVRGGDNNEPS